ncbi:carboxymuconolactone decarboxylase family protein [Streptomyces sp. NPDC101194]|uniref:carboxymuconolactone decarboxylase family protein n=1 Tax=Streptomyces sp. NPDC101194 TaxID=3366127 RepID=UPI00380C5D48
MKPRTRTKEHTTDARLNCCADPTAGKALKYFMSAGRALKDSPLPAATQELVALRVSQIDGCAACIDMHTDEAAAVDDPSARLNLIAAWREATVFTEAEHAALEPAEEGIRVADAASRRTRSTAGPACSSATGTERCSTPWPSTCSTDRSQPSAR